MAGLRGFAQRVVAPDIGLWHIGQHQILARIDGRRCDGFAVNLAVQQVQPVRLVGTPAVSAISTAKNTAFSSCCSTGAKISTISRSPPGFLKR